MYSREKGIADHYWPRAVFSPSLPLWSNFFFGPVTEARKDPFLKSADDRFDLDRVERTVCDMSMELCDSLTMVSCIKTVYCTGSAKKSEL